MSNLKHHVFVVFLFIVATLQMLVLITNVFMEDGPTRLFPLVQVISDPQQTPGSISHNIMFGTESGFDCDG